MASEISKRLLLAALAMASCAHDPRKFALRSPVERDQDLDAITIACKPDKPCGPKLYESSFAWDATDNEFFRPVSEGLILKPGGAARNVNAFDEVPDSSWFVNRIGKGPMSASDVAQGYCRAGKVLSDDPADGAWTIDHGKDNGANPGFRINVDGVKYMLKIDDTQKERATGATSIASRVYYAAGFWAPCDSVVYFKRSTLVLKPGLEIKANVGPAKKFDEKRLDEILKEASTRDGRYRAAASRWLPGNTIGPFTYGGTREDNPSDVVPHEHRRELRGVRVLAAWLNHFDTREQNSMETWLDADDVADEAAGYAGHPKSERKHDPKAKSASLRGFVRHWYIDLGDSFGSEWSVDAFSRRLGHSYLLDWGDVGVDFITLGILQRPWDRAKRSPEAPSFGYFSAQDFDPDSWRAEYANPAFSNMEEADAAWMTRIIARFDESHLEALVGVGNYPPQQSAFLLRVLRERQRILLRRYFSKLSPVTDVTIEDGKVCAVDLARKTETYVASAFSYAVRVRRGPSDHAEVLAVAAEASGRVCMSLASAVPNGGVPDDDASRYLVVELKNGATPGSLLLHFYDLGAAKGLKLVGIERPAP